MIQVAAHSGNSAHAYIEDLARLRMAVFAEYPYLYDGDLDYERHYVRTYLDAPDSLLVVATDGDRVVGVSTGIPLMHEVDEIKAPWLAVGHDIGRIFYYGESVLLPEYRGQGIGIAFYQQREAHARRLGCSHVTFCAVLRPDDHPARPKDYVPLDAFWRRRGFTPLPGMVCHIAWKDHGEPEETAKALGFWWKEIRAAPGERLRRSVR